MNQQEAAGPSLSPNNKSAWLRLTDGSSNHLPSSAALSQCPPWALFQMDMGDKASGELSVRCARVEGANLEINRRYSFLPPHHTVTLALIFLFHSI